METINDRISARRRAQKMSQDELAKRIGITRVSISKWESGLNQPKGRYLNDLAAALGVTVDWLLTGDGEARGQPAPEAMPGYHNVEPAVIPHGRQVPVLSYVQAGHWREICEQATAFDGSLEFVTVGVEISPCGFGLWVRGNSMEPQFKEGDLLIVDPDEAPKAGDFVIAKNGSDEATFKKYRARGEYDNGQPRFELVPLNEDHETLSTDQTPITIIGVVVEHRSFFKRGA
ncbi:LexA family protein [Aeromonas sanarellii]|uniref:LexA family protein n=1 Tax=Aeromonas sanarellii TaxID=633415 RepID=UPI00399FE11D